MTTREFICFLGDKPPDKAIYSGMAFNDRPYDVPLSDYPKLQAAGVKPGDVVKWHVGYGIVAWGIAVGEGE